MPVFFAIYRWGLAFIQGIQGIKSPGLTALMKGITALGSEYFYIPLILFIFWCVNEKKGLRLGLIILVSAFINGFFKDLLKQPRPFNLEASVGLVFEPSYGFPSGHAQLSLCFWLPLAFWLSRSRRTATCNTDFSRQVPRATCNEVPRAGKMFRAAVWGGAIFFVLLIAFTRLYLGVHFPTDILGGWFLGGLILLLWYFFRKPVTALLNAGKLRAQMIAAALIALGMNALYPADSSLGGLFLGFAAGHGLTLHYFPRSNSDEQKPSPLILAARYALGLGGAALIYLGFKTILPGENSLFSGLPLWGAGSPYFQLGRFVRYGLLGLWAAAGAPLVFLRLHLTEVSQNDGERD
ncbi:membrane-associated phospholipid phosphatase [Treponema primitia ZAS-2]|uniref:Membrane-associated phospholipid phosphatase n=1 Tax=Treponema primitia (strain ATCC BAA-887 / DSM 12427 / ZAS-2) TaxID=545694 RepID=F5YHC2_TREPZ|nr:membrane-associated phospholipid phosphatase [Treponema primitia ZAS-2]